MTVALAVPAPAAHAGSGRTLWLMQPLYPGQEALVSRMETAIQPMFSPEARAQQLIGRSELREHLRGRKVGLECVLGDVPCLEPFAELMRTLGISDVILVQGGQAESLYRFRVVRVGPEAEPQVAEVVDANFGKALRGALVKVVPLTATLALTSTPPGASVYVDDELLGKTPLRGIQVLAGERTIRIERPSFKPLVFTQVVTIGQTLELTPVLEAKPWFLVSRRTWGFVSLGTGLAATAGGVVMGSSALTQARYAKSIPQTQRELYQREASAARRTALAADGLYVLGAACVGLGAWFIISDQNAYASDRPAPVAPAGRQFAVLPLPGGGAVSVGGSF